MLVSRTALLLLGLAALGWLSPAAMQEVRTFADGLDDRKAFGAIVDPDIPLIDLPAGSHAAGKATTLTRSSDGLFYVRVLVNDRPVRFVVDTGSSMVVLAPHDAARLKLAATTSGGRQMQTANGAVRIETTSLKHIRIGERSVRNVDAVIVREGLPTSLLGQNLLSRLGPIMIEGDQLSL